MLRKLFTAFAFLSMPLAAARAQGPGTTDYRMLGAPLPPFRVVTDEGQVLTEKDAPKGENFILMFFNPTCDHCQEAMHVMGANQALFKDGQVVLVAGPAMQPHLEFFNNVTRYKKYPVFRVGLDSSQLIEKLFAYQTMPQFNIYNRNRKLVRMFTGSMELDSLKPYLGPAARQHAGAVPPRTRGKKRGR